MRDVVEEVKIRKELAGLVDAWTIYKDEESKVRDRRLAIEKNIEELLDIDRSVVNTHILPKGLKMFCSSKKAWDQDFIKRHLLTIPKNQNPFIEFYKEDTKKMKELEMNNYNLWEILQEGCSMRPSKPSFTYPKKFQSNNE